jgi:hypothetical protein
VKVAGFFAAVVALAPVPPAVPAQEAAQTPASYIVFVGSSQGRCVYMTGDVLFDAGGFRDDLRSRFSRSDGIIIYHQRDVRPNCLAKARRIVLKLGFRVTAVEEAPEDLDMGPPR